MPAPKQSFARTPAPFETGYVVTTKSAYAEALFRRGHLVFTSKEAADRELRFLSVGQTSSAKVYRCDRKTNHDGVIVVATEA